MAIYLFLPMDNSTGSSTGHIFILSIFLLSLTTEHYILLLIYISHYSIAHYIKLLQARLVNAKTAHSSLDTFWSGSKKVLLHLQRANAALGSVFSVPVLYMITMQLTMASFILFETIYGGLIRQIEFLSNSIMTSPLIVLLFKYLFGVYIILHSADMPVKQVRAEMILPMFLCLNFE